MKQQTLLEELVLYARLHSRFYQDHYQSVPDQDFTLHDLPLINAANYWVNCNDLYNWPVLTQPVDDALVLKTGGSTAHGKLSVYSRREWQVFVSAFGESLSTQLNSGDRVANLFFSGDLYASFLFIHEALAQGSVPICEFPFTGAVELDVLLHAIEQYRINVLAGVPAQLLRFAAYLKQQGHVLPKVETLLYGGESLFAPQLAILSEVFPSARIASIGYASVDAGLIGATARDCALGEHRVFEGQTLLEIIDEHTGEVIDACDCIGSLVVTNLNRRLMPLLRYPVGDRACWREPAATPGRKFALHGRSTHSQRVRVGVLSLMSSDIDPIVQRIAGSHHWQLVIEQAGVQDIVRVRWVPGSQSALPEATAQAMRDALVSLYPAINELTRDGLLDFEVVPCAITDLTLHPRSGKQLRVLDLRVYALQPSERS